MSGPDFYYRLMAFASKLPRGQFDDPGIKERWFDTLKKSINGLASEGKPIVPADNAYLYMAAEAVIHDVKDIARRSAAVYDYMLKAHIESYGKSADDQSAIFLRALQNVDRICDYRRPNFSYTLPNRDDLKSEGLRGRKGDFGPAG